MRVNQKRIEETSHVGTIDSRRDRQRHWPAVKSITWSIAVFARAPFKSFFVWYRKILRQSEELVPLLLFLFWRAFLDSVATPRFVFDSLYRSENSVRFVLLRELHRAHCRHTACKFETPSFIVSRMRHLLINDNCIWLNCERIALESRNVLLMCNKD